MLTVYLVQLHIYILFIYIYEYFTGPKHVRKGRWQALAGPRPVAQKLRISKLIDM